MPRGDIGHYRWVICALLFFATTVNYMDRQILSLIKETLDARLGWTNEQFGLVNSAFQGAYALGLLGFGWFVDRFGAKIGYAVSIAAWSLAAMGHALAGNVAGFVSARIALGLGEAGNFPAAIKTTAQWFPKAERALATSLFNAGATIGPVIAPAIVPWIAVRWGWQAAFVGVGLAGLLWLCLWLPIYNAPERTRWLSRTELEYINGGRENTGIGAKISWRTLLRMRQAWSFVVAKFMTDPVWWFFLIWLPDYFKKTRGLEISRSWVYLVAIYSIITVLSIIGGWLPGRLIQRGWSVTRARKTGMFCFALCVLPMFAVARAGDWTAVVLIGLAGAAHQAWSANLFTTVSDMFPQNAVASVVGLGGMMGSVGGILFPIFCGRVLDHFGKTGRVTAGYSMLFAICASAYLLAFALNHLCAPSFKPVNTESYSA